MVEVQYILVVTKKMIKLYIFVIVLMLKSTYLTNIIVHTNKDMKEFETQYVHK